MMKSLQQYTELPDELKATYLIDNGEFIIRFTSDELASDLYTLHNFFVEVLYDYAENNIAGFHIHRDVTCLEKFLGMIDLDVLVNL